MQSVIERFSALGDPCRLEIIEILSAGPRTVGELKEQFSMTLPGLLKHVRKLERSELIRTKKEGRTVICHLNPGSFADLETWIGKQMNFWNEALNRLEDLTKGKELPGK